VPVDYCALEAQIRPRDHIEVLRPFLPARYSPLRASGDGLQGIYLAEVPEQMADALVALIGQAYFVALASIGDFPSEPDTDTLRDPDDGIVIGPTFKEQLVRARRGQGVFRSNVLLRNEFCRVTGVREPRHLKASHIKPWRDASDTERLDGDNGLLLSPHVDHLFDDGYITFSSNQELLVVPDARDKVFDAWGIDASVRVGEFSREQNAYLEYHRINVFKGGVE
jgi:putative restriction endonuclease